MGKVLFVPNFHEELKNVSQIPNSVFTLPRLLKFCFAQGRRGAFLLSLPSETELLWSTASLNKFVFGELCSKQK